MESFQTLPGTLRQPQKLSPLGAQARAAGEKAGFSLARDTENGPEWVAFSAALQYDYNINYLTLTPEQAEPFLQTKSFCMIKKKKAIQ